MRRDRERVARLMDRHRRTFGRYQSIHMDIPTGDTNVEDSGDTFMQNLTFRTPPTTNSNPTPLKRSRMQIERRKALRRAPSKEIPWQDYFWEKKDDPDGDDHFPSSSLSSSLSSSEKTNGEDPGMMYETNLNKGNIDLSYLGTQMSDDWDHWLQ